VKVIKGIFILVIFILAIGLAGCGEGDSPQMEDITWVLESYGEPGNTNPALEETEITVLFDSARGEVGGSAGCNGYGGTYELDGNELTFPGPFILTMMYCNEQINDQEKEYTSILQDAASYEIKGGKLTIYCGDNVLIYRQQ
jgi:heat shock protein HslJ